MIHYNIMKLFLVLNFFKKLGCIDGKVKPEDKYNPNKIMSLDKVNLRFIH